MNNTSSEAGFGRRTFLVLLAPTIGFFAWIATRQGAEKENPMAKVAPFVRPKDKWTAAHFYNFLNALPVNTMLALKQSLGISNAASERQLKGYNQDARDVQKHALWLSSYIFAYPFRDETQLKYHDLVTWVSGEAGISQDVVQNASTFSLERELHKLLFAQLWDKLKPEQRKELLAKVDPNGTIKDKAAIVALGGAGALAALSATVAFTGFAFYTTMSVTIATVAGAVGVTLPFATYAGASTVLGVLSGPVGWAIMGVAALGGVALVGRPNLQKTTALIGQMHALKVEALIAANVPFPE